MRGDLKYIESNAHLKWEDFLQAPRDDPWDGSAWFTVEVGPDDGINAGEMFQVLVVTPAAISRVKPSRGEFRCVVAKSLDPETVLRTLREHISAISAGSWSEIREGLRKSMWWEWEDCRKA